MSKKSLPKVSNSNESIITDGMLLGMLEELGKIKKKMSILLSREKSLKEFLIAASQNRTVLFYDNAAILFYKDISKKILDQKSLKNDFPEIYDKYVRKVNFRSIVYDHFIKNE